MKHTSSEANHYVSMGVFMILAGFLSTMNIWANSFEDIRFSLNDVYMVGLMTSWMFLFMSIYDRKLVFSGLSFAGVAIFLYLIRTQTFVSEKQFLLGMIPHHSMAILMSQKLATKPNSIPELLSSIQKTQTEEIAFMKGRLAAMK